MYPDARRSSLPSTTSAATEGALRGRAMSHLLPAARRGRRRDVPGAASALPGGHRVLRPDAATTWCVSSSSAWAHAVICDEHAMHVCYCYNPFRYAWNERQRTLAERRDPLARAALRSSCAAGASGTGSPRSGSTATWPSRTSPGAASAATSGRESHVVLPAGDTGRFSPADRPGDYHLVLSELVLHKQIDDRGRGLHRPGAAARGGRRRPRRAPAARAGRPDGDVHRPRQRRRGRAPARRAAAPSCSRPSRSSASPASRRRPPGRPVIAQAGAARSRP